MSYGQDKITAFNCNDRGSVDETEVELVVCIIYLRIKLEMKYGLFPQDDISKRVPRNLAVI